MVRVARWELALDYIRSTSLKVKVRVMEGLKEETMARLGTSKKKGKEVAAARLEDQLQLIHKKKSFKISS